MFPNIPILTYLFLLLATLDLAFARRGGGGSGSGKISDAATIGICAGVGGPLLVGAAAFKYYEWRGKRKKREPEKREAQQAAGGWGM
ncbi:hypothetical protein EX30DRAFT_343618 [Ascodesmis nigricans]|uniref:Uncharacterized protein n=1 Tax=Ascodesmis nigricans TaxID=341454 RepID=A0A4V3SHY4_9PEZI|nr:hypothetical protein EX30DRAFT_343618 [Ascodesmis nigricans]